MKVVIRADSSDKIGTGHIMRCLSLAQTLRAHGHEAVFVSRAWPGHCIDRIQAQNFAVLELNPDPTAFNIQENETEWHRTFQWREDAKATAEAAPADWLVADHYAVQAEWLNEMRKVCRHTLVIDDLINRDLPADLLLDPGLAPRPEAHSGRTLLGPRYALLRPEFHQAHTQVRVRGNRQILLFMTGGDDYGTTLKIAQALEPLNVDVRGVVSSNTRERAELTALFQRRNWKLEEPSAKLIHWLQEADVAIGAGGSSLWERCCLGLPTAVISLAPNQDVVLPYAQKAGLIHYLGKKDELKTPQITESIQKFLADTEGLKRMADLCRHAVDGQGAERTVEAMMRANITNASAPKSSKR